MHEQIEENIGVKMPKYSGNGKITDYYKKRLLVYFLSNLPKMSPIEEKRIKKAYFTAFAAHKGVFRKGGEQEPYITHPVEVAIIVSKEMGFGTTSVIAALLHDVVEDNPDYSLDYIKEQFGEKVRIIVDGVTKITRISGKASSEQLETFRNMILTIPKDFRVLLIKIADRLHNMRTMDDMPDNSRRIKSSENLYLYAKLAEMAGFWEIKKELENRSFKYLYSDEYILLKKLSDEFDEKAKQEISAFQKKLNTIFITEYKYKIITVDRSLYSIWKKMKKRNTPFSNISNRFSSRIIIEMPSNDAREIAYNFFLQITKFFHERNNSLRDWIIKPKMNGFRALIFDVMEDGNWREIQILSSNDDKIATRGFIKGQEFIFPGLKNLAEAIEDNIESEETNEIMERVKDFINPSKIFIFTPKGESIEMSKGITVLDFAFRIHSDLGLKCLGAKINDNQGVKPPTYILQTTQKVEILTSDKVKPHKEWLDFLQTSRAKKALINYFNKIEENIVHEKIENIAIKEFNSKKPLIINDNIDFQLAHCCNPIIGDKAMVVKNSDGQFIIHKETCANAISLRATDSKNTTTVIWEHINKFNALLVGIEFEGFDRIGILKDIVNIVTSELQINIKRINIENIEGLFTGRLELYISSLEILNETLSKLIKIENMNKVERSDKIISNSDY